MTQDEAARAVITNCIDGMAEILGEVHALTAAAKACSDSSNPEAALRVAMDIEPLLSEANGLLQAACLIKRRMCVEAGRVSED